MFTNQMSMSDNILHLIECKSNQQPQKNLMEYSIIYLVLLRADFSEIKNNRYELVSKTFYNVINSEDFWREKFMFDQRIPKLGLEKNTNFKYLYNKFSEIKLDNDHFSIYDFQIKLAFGEEIMNYPHCHPLFTWNKLINLEGNIEEANNALAISDYPVLAYLIKKGIRPSQDSINNKMSMDLGKSTREILSKILNS